MHVVVVHVNGVAGHMIRVNTDANQRSGYNLNNAMTVSGDSQVVQVWKTTRVLSLNEH